MSSNVGLGTDLEQDSVKDLLSDRGKGLHINILELKVDYINKERGTQSAEMFHVL